MTYRKYIIVLGSLTLMVAGIALGADDTGAGIPFKENGADLVGAFIKSIIALVFLLILAIVGLLVARRYFPGLGINKPSVPGQRIKLLEVRRLTPRTILFLVEVDGEEMLLAQGENITRLDRKGDPFGAPELLSGREA